MLNWFYFALYISFIHFERKQKPIGSIGRDYFVMVNPPVFPLNTLSMWESPECVKRCIDPKVPPNSKSLGSLPVRPQNSRHSPVSSAPSLQSRCRLWARLWSLSLYIVTKVLISYCGLVVCRNILEVSGRRGATVRKKTPKWTPGSIFDLLYVIFHVTKSWLLTSTSIYNFHFLITLK